MDHALSPFARWESFYVIIGSSAAALTGLQFVVIALGAEARTLRGPELGAFGTPTVVHFCAVLLVAAIVTAPWHAVESAAVALCISAAAGVAYVVIVALRARRQMGYAPVLEDWLWHAVFPLAAYATTLVGGSLLARDPAAWLFAISGAALALLFIGIHNAWDSVTYIAVERSKREGR